jgi:hypothetical protein
MLRDMLAAPSVEAPKVRVLVYCRRRSCHDNTVSRPHTKCPLLEWGVLSANPANESYQASRYPRSNPCTNLVLEYVHVYRAVVFADNVHGLAS